MTITSLPIIVLVTTLAFATCNPPPGVVAAYPSESERQLVLAQQLAQAGEYRRAIHLCSIVAEQAPGTEAGATATLRTALMLSSPRNPERNDSLAIQWFRATIARTKSLDERLQAEVSIALLDRLLFQSRDAHRQRVLVDSLQLAVRRQSGTILSQTRRLMDMEREVVATRDELKRIRDIDIRLSRIRDTR